MAGLVNSAAIQKKVEEYAASTAGKKRMRERIEGYFEQGREKTDGGSRIITRGQMNWLADELVSIIKEMAAADQLPESVMEHFDSLSHSQPERRGQNDYFIELRFEDDLSRPSFEVVMWSGGGWETTGSYTGEGINNIISLFNTGYEAKTTVFGWWASKGIVANSIPFRDGLHFLDRSVDAFNQKYGREYRVVASLAMNGI